MDLLVETLKGLKQGKKVRIPTYSFTIHNRTDKWLNIYGANVIILEGIYALYDPRVLALMDIKIFVDTDFDICLARRLNRDILHRGRELVLSIHQWERFVKPNFDRYIKHTMGNADILVPRGLDNVVAIGMLANHIQRQLVEKSSQHVSDIISLGIDPSVKVCEKVIQIDQTNQILGMHTILYDHSISRHDFVFYFDRVAKILVNRALDEIRYYSPQKVVTPLGASHDGVRLPFEDICAVTIIRGGECFNNALRYTIPTIKLGKLLIQSDSRTGEPQLHTMSLPPLIDPKPASDGSVRETDIYHLKRTTVLLVDAHISSGAAATMATAVLLDHGVNEEDIIFITYLASEVGLKRLTSAFPRITVVVARREPGVIARFIDTAYYGT
jgi:uridine kinase